MKHALLCAAALVALSVPASANTQAKFTKLLVDSSKSENPSVSFLQGVGRIGNGQLNQKQVRAALAAAQAEGVVIHPQLKNMLGDVKGLKVSGGNKVQIRLSKKSSLPLTSNGQVQGWAHLKTNVSFRVRNKGKKLDRFRGLKLSKTKGGMSAGPNSMTFFTAKNGDSNVTVDLGLFAGKHTFTLKKAQKGAELAPQEGLEAILTRNV